MRIFKREMWSYVVLLLILFALASVSVSQVLVHLYDLLKDPEREFPSIALLILLVTMGFMFLAGAFGVWNIRFVTEKEAQRRLAQLVDAMDHIQDGMLVVDRSGHIVAMNASAKRISLSREESGSFASAFAGLSGSAVERLLSGEDTVEVEESISSGSLPQRTLRFRSQPVGNLCVIMVSDVTSINVQRLHTRVKARLQLLGELARGVAYDFDSLLTDISGYTALLARVPRASSEFDEALRAIVRSAERGSSLAEQILALARQGTAGSPTDMVLEHAKSASDDLASILPPEWEVAFSGEGPFEVTALSGLQIEQIILNLGLLVTENRRTHGTVSVALSQSSPESREGFVGVLLVHGATSIHDALQHTFSNSASAPSGVILSVIRSIVEDANGRLDAALTAEGVPCFRVWLPKGAITTVTSSPSSLPADQGREIAGWRVLLACTNRPELQQRLEELGATVHAVNGIVSALAFLEQEHELDAMVIDHHLLRPETRGLLRAIRKLRPDCGVVVLAESEDAESELPEGMTYASRYLTTDGILVKLLGARRSALGIVPQHRHHPLGKT